MQGFEKVLKQFHGMKTFVIRPAISTLVVLAVPISPGVALGILTWVYADGVVAGTILIIGALAIWLSVATIRVELDEDYLSKYQFFRVQWSHPTSDICFKDGLAGDVPIIPAIIFMNRDNRNVIGTILKPQFHQRDIEALLTALRAAQSGRLNTVT